MPDGQQYDNHQTYAGDDAINVKRATNHMPDEDRPRQTVDQLQGEYGNQQAKDLAPHTEVDDRPGFGSAPNWASYDQDTLVTMATKENDPSLADSLGRAFVQNGNELATAANELNDALTALDANWQGKAASSARGSIQPLAQHAGHTGTSAQLMGASLSQQSSAAQEAQRIPPANNFDKSTFLNKALAPYGGADNADANQKNLANTDANRLQGEADANKAAQVKVMQNYTSAMQTADKMPVFVPPPETVAKGGGKAPTHSTGGGVKARSTGNPHHPVQGTTPGVPTAGGAPADSGPGGHDGQDGGDLPSISGPITGGTSTSGYAGNPLPSTVPGAGGGGIAGGPTPAPGAGSGGFGGAFGNFGGAGQRGGPGGPGGTGAFGEEGGLRGGAGAEGGSGARGGLGGGAGGSGAGLEGGGRGAAGARGAGMGMGALEEGFQRGGTGAGGRGGMTGMGGAPGAHGDGEDDDEHQRPSYLVEPDPDAVFDTDQMTAPPVIGAE